HRTHDGVEEGTDGVGQAGLVLEGKVSEEINQDEVPSDGHVVFSRERRYEGDLQRRSPNEEPAGGVVSRTHAEPPIGAEYRGGADSDERGKRRVGVGKHIVE